MILAGKRRKINKGRLALAITILLSIGGVLNAMETIGRANQPYIISQEKKLQSKKLLLSNITKKIPLHSKKTPSRGGRRKHLGRLDITAYNLKGKTASGKYTRAGLLAVDPKYIPLGTKLKIEGLPGIYTAADTGRLIKGITPGRRNTQGERLANIDLWLADKEDCKNWGRRGAKVWIIK